MRLFQRLQDCIGLPVPIVTIGNFDGLHLGHQAVLKLMRGRAIACRGTVVVLTFDPHPLRVLTPAVDLRFLSDPEEKLALLKEAGVDVVVRLPFTPAFAAQKPEEFMQTVLVEGVGAHELYVGQNFRFGQGRRGTIQTLQEAAPQLGFTVHVITPIVINGVPVSSTRIRELIQTGAVDHAAVLLGRPYVLKGRVIRGEKRGEELGYPTANMLPPDARVLPPDGVYATQVQFDSHAVAAATYIGIRPTFIPGRRLIETHLLEGAQDLYDREIAVAFHERLRGDMIFESAALLARQIAEDVERAREVFRRSSIPAARVTPA